VATRGKSRTVVFARINRRMAGQDTLSGRGFGNDMRRLAESRLTRFHERGKDNQVVKTWIAADMKTDPSDTFLVGTLGYSIREERKAFDEASWSWIKGESDNEDRASERTVAPFAVDLRDHNRWVAFAPIGHLSDRSLASGLVK
jgi:hypothetical protein